VVCLLIIMTMTTMAQQHYVLGAACQMVLDSRHGTRIVYQVQMHVVPVTALLNDD
jgi:hypothetical protein